MENTKKKKSGLVNGRLDLFFFLINDAKGPQTCLNVVNLAPVLFPVSANMLAKHSPINKALMGPKRRKSICV